MDRTQPQLDYIINADNFRKIQDSLAEATEMALLTVDLKGNPITTHSRCTAFCSLVRSDRDLNDQCRKCDARGGLEAARLRQPYVYQCHMGLIDLAVPLVAGDQYLGAILAGQIQLADGDPRGELEILAHTDRRRVALPLLGELDRLRARLPALTLDRIQVVSRMLFHISNYIVAEALSKMELIGELRPLGPPQGIALGGPEDLVGAPLVLRPAFERIRHHYAEALNLDDLAARCGISSHYFSKLFNRATGENLARYVHRVRVAEAKKRLRETGDPVTLISFDLGFEDSGYFDKVFKKLVGKTPSDYRREAQAGGPQPPNGKNPPHPENFLLSTLKDS